ncbi:hypothetical protein CSB45_13815 [candidate division KSB3 bacterium]|uniref:DNA-directed RNA polymerase subunit omega n=1 Tax=candidate division KSB3 bacterium TaxID=2044937 RepID=A0A2G6E1W7_9BACT|nr:MAG: hypothetical protein CSB45_13815 [candidate division KSB3 bacterium]PIE28515.1 MAG: hypothetical protein CSA57_13500 [candidate division KSB3 bacterium]
MFRFDLLSKAMEKEPNKFLLVQLLSKRMHQLADGASPLSVKTHEADVNIALQEFLDSAIELQPKEELSEE